MKNRYSLLKTPLAVLIVILSLLAAPESKAQFWSKTGNGVNALNASGEIFSLCSDPSGKVYAVGEFTTGAGPSDGYPYVARWNGASWGMLGTGVNALDTICVLNAVCSDALGNIYVGGIDDIDGYFQVAKWDGTSWSQLADLHGNGAFNTICADRSGNIYVAGDFTDVSGNTYVAKWDGSAWWELGDGFNGSISSLCTDPAGNLYAVGNFTDVSGNYFCAKWNGSSWSDIGGFGGVLYQVCTDNSGNVYVCGDFPYYVAELSGGSWYSIGSVFNGNVFALCSDASGRVYAGGDFFDATSYFGYVAMWDGASWWELGYGSGAMNANGRILAICADLGGNVYAGGQFTYAGRYYVAKYTAPNAVKSLFKPSENGLHIYPNPSHGAFMVEMKSQFSTATLTITDVLGNSVFEKRCDGSASGNISVNLTSLPLGAYIVRMTTDGNTAQQMITIQ